MHMKTVTSVLLCKESHIAGKPLFLCTYMYIVYLVDVLAFGFHSR